MQVFESSISAELVATFLKNTGEAATISGTPQVTIYYVSSGAAVTQLSTTNMTQLTGSSYFYSWSVPSPDNLRVYIVRYSATYSDSTSVVGEETVLVVPKWFYSRRWQGGGWMKEIIKGDESWKKEEKDNLLNTIEKLNKAVSMMITKSNSDTSTKFLETIQKDLKLNSKVLLKMASVSALKEVLDEQE